MHITILLLGITGNVAKLKVLPGIHDFASGHPLDIVDLVGYSRSVITESEVVKSLSAGSPHQLHSITLRTGEYNDLSVFQELLKATTPDSKLVVYLAVPPSVYTDFIAALPENLPSNIVILIEKPFGENPSNLQTIANDIESKKLENNILFLDHYLFKNGLALQPTKIPLSTITSVHVSAIETVGIEDRLGYYATIGAVQDMFVHLLNLTRAQLSALTGEQLSFPTSLVVTESILGQYQSVASQLPTTIPTYFDIQGTLFFGTYELNFRFISGKKLNEKCTVTSFVTTNSPITWQINPKIELTEGALSYQVGVTSSDHQNIFEQAVGAKKGFLSITEALQISKLEKSILDQISTSKLCVYPDDSTIESITKLAISD